MSANLTKYQAAADSANNAFNAKASAYEFSRKLGQRRHKRDNADFRQSFSRSQNPFQQQWGSRGMGSSGFYKEALQRRTTDYTRDRGRMFEDQQSQLNELDMGFAADKQARDDALASIEAQKAAEIAQTGQWLEMLAPYLNR